MAGAASWPGLAAHERWLESESDRLLGFSAGAVHPDGGFAWLGNEGTPDLRRPVELWVTCRMTHVFSLGSLLGRPGCGPLADHGVAALTGRMRDPTHGGWYAQVDASGPVTRSKTAYEHAFVVLAAASAQAASRPGADALLAEALDVLLGHFYDERHGMVVEEWDESFATLDDYRGGNANMHAVEALLAAADVLGDDSLRERAQRILTRVVHDLARGHRWRIPEHFDPSWNPVLDYHRDQPAHPFRPFGATVGHWLEWARLALHLRAQLQAAGVPAPAWMLDDAISLFDAAVREGWAVDGEPGFVYTVDWDGSPVVRARMHWVVAEAIAAAAALLAATGETAYAEWYRTWWDYVASHVRDDAPGGGSWHHELSPSNEPSATTWSGKPDTYHAFQATLIPRLPLAPTLAAALRDGWLR